MNWFGMKGALAYIRYTELCNQCQDVLMSDFKSTNYLIAHAEALERKTPIEE